MKKLLSYRVLVITLLLGFVGLAVYVALPDDEIDFNADVKPIVNKHCISCHGGVKQSGGFSLLFEEEAKGNTTSGAPAIIPGHPDKSEMILRLLSNDPEERMPYEKDPLSHDEIQILKTWIQQGAKWDTHWTYIPVEKVEVPSEMVSETQFTEWAKNDIDNYIYEKTSELKLVPSIPADIATLARRMSLDLIGLPPPIDAFTQLSESQDLDMYVDQLLSSPHFGEKWAGIWMDLARYSDTKGYERDDSRTIWKYRDWLINAYNEDKPYDQFLLEQIAGDLLEHPSDDQLIATAFHRNTMTNDEGGTDNEEFRVAAVMDRVNTTWEVTMGTTYACVQCHSHPFDPFKHEDYYKFMSFFNNSRDEDTYDDYPVLRNFEGEDSVKAVELKVWLEKNTTEKKAAEVNQFVKTWQPSINSLTSDKFVNSELADTKWLVFRNNGSSRFANVNLDGKNTLIYRYRNFYSEGVWKIYLDSIGGKLLKEIKVADKRQKWTVDEIQFQNVSGAHDLYFTYFNPNITSQFANGLMFDWLYFTEEFPAKKSEGYQEAKNNFWHLVQTGTLQTPIMQENPIEMKRETHVFERGNWMALGKVVEPGLPEVFDKTIDEELNNRLDLAEWMVSTKNPLTARTYVNRIWAQFFGYGIVETLEDMGSQGIPPTHQELLDHLSWKFMHEFQWSTKALIKYIVSSATYQQSSVSNPHQLQVDPQNRYYSRGPRIRLNAEQIRDQALVVSGLFSSKMFGPSVMPFQPDRIWNSPYNGRKWVQSQGEDQYRRAIYTYWKRTSPYPSMMLFDAMAREVCSSRRISTNTPLQALVTLNDSVYVEAAISLANQMDAEGGNTIADQIKYGYKLMMFKEIPDDKLTILVNLYNTLSKEELIKNVAIRESDFPEDKHNTAMNIVANTMLNLDEFIMKN